MHLIFDQQKKCVSHNWGVTNQRRSRHSSNASVVVEMTINTRWRENIYHPETLSGLSVPTQICILVHIHRPRISSWGSLCHVTICWISLVKSICKTVPAVAYYPFFLHAWRGNLTPSVQIYTKSEVRYWYTSGSTGCIVEISDCTQCKRKAAV